MSQVSQPWFTASELRFLDILCASHAPPMSGAMWQEIVDQFYMQQVRHLPGGDLHDSDPWPQRVRVAHVIYTDERFPVGENMEAQRAVQALLGFVYDPEQDQGEVQLQVQPQENQNMQIPEGSTRLPAGNIRLPEGSILLPDRSVLFPDGRLLLTNSPNQAPPFIFLPDGRIRLPNGRMFRGTSDIENPVPRANIRFRNGRPHLPNGTVIPMAPRTPETPMAPINPLPPRPLTPPRAPMALMVPGTPHISPTMSHNNFQLPDGRFHLPPPAVPSGSVLLHDGRVRFPNGTYLPNTYSPPGTPSIPSTSSSSSEDVN
ncbi:hypothetical protein OCU04_002155 [Sclerotinia nivalis]|uniref:Uncharacterized protein n=1 Tax=Sclerotinia nivalis TaxID=352851 RepID=A0A9X0AZK4_9HELO|nr:hypothetical protein OCU04_002155 [Sclerotinia nivalis]